MYWNQVKNNFQGGAGLKPINLPWYTKALRKTIISIIFYYQIFYILILTNQMYTAALIALISIHLNYTTTLHAQHSFYHGFDLKILPTFPMQFTHDITQASASMEAYNPIIVPITRGDELIKYKVVYSETKGGFPISSFFWSWNLYLI